MRWLLLITFALLSGCGEGYRAPTALVRLEVESTSDLDSALLIAAKEFQARGFKPSRPMQTADESSDFGKALAWRESNKLDFWQHRGNEGFYDRDVSISLIPYPDPGKGWCGVGRCGTTPADIAGLNYPFLEMSVSEGRPGGFSADGLAVYADAVSVLRQQRGTVVIVEPPQINEAEYERVTSTNTIASLVWWLIAWTIYMVIIGMIGLSFARSASRTTRRIMLVILGASLVTPLPYGTGFFTFYVPACLAWTNVPTLTGQARLLLPLAFAASFVLSVAAAMVCVRHRAPSRSPGEA